MTGLEGGHPELLKLKVNTMSYAKATSIEEPQPKVDKNSKDKERTARALSHRTAARIRKVSLIIFNRSERLALVSTLGLLAVWLIGRVMETLHGNTIFDTTLTYWLGLNIYVLMAIWAVSFIISTVDALRTDRPGKLSILNWLFFACMAAVLILTFKGYRIASWGLLATIAGSQESSEMAIFLLYKYYFLNPLLALNLAASKMMGLSWEVQSFAPFVWTWNVLLGFFIWSVAFGILLLLQKGKQGLKSVYLVLSAFGLLGLIILKSASTPTIEQMSMIQATALILIVAQMFLAYSALRTAAAEPADQDSNNGDPLSVRPAGNDQTAGKRFAGLPPSALTLTLVLFIVVPLVADMHNQFLTASSSNQILEQVALDEESSKAGFAAVAALSIRTGPTQGDNVIGVLPKGARIQVRDKRDGWLEIGENAWIQDQFIRPLQDKN